MADPTLVPLPPPSPHSSPGGTSRGLPGSVPATAGGGLDVQSEEDEDDLKVISVSSDDQPATGKSLTHLLSIGPPLSSPDLLQSLEQQQQQQEQPVPPDQDARSDNSGSSSSTEEGQESAAEATESHQQASSPPTKAGLAFSDTNL